MVDKCLGLISVCLLRKPFIIYCTDNTLWTPTCWRLGKGSNDDGTVSGLLESIRRFWTSRKHPTQLTHWGRDKMDPVSQTTLSNAFYWMTMTIRISLKFVSKSPIYNIPTLVQIMAWRRPDDKPLSEPMMVRLPTHIYTTRPQWVK